MPNAFTGFHQLAYVATDLERAIAVFATLGVPKWQRMGLVTLPLEDGHEVSFQLALAFVGAVQLEIIEPAGGSDGVYREALPDEGFGLVWHHVAFKVPTLERLEEVRGEVGAANIPIALAGGQPEVAKFFYADARDTLGHYVEYIYFTPERLAHHASLPRND